VPVDDHPHPPVSGMIQALPPLNEVLAEGRLVPADM